LSREHFPKQLLALTGPQTLLQQTALRLDGIEGVEPAIVVCNEEHRFLVAEQLRQIDRHPQAILLEPFGRNTAPALALAALAINNPDAVMLVMPADHIIQDLAAFHAAVRQGHADEKACNLGIPPATGWLSADHGLPPASKIDFVEKPPGAGLPASGDISELC
jgi:mannose-1-phosphate guanylyltransferase/mannose-1-phosphate guanylyltransferase/mannose-6-phosphate isomerase